MLLRDTSLVLGIVNCLGACVNIALAFLKLHFECLKFTFSGFFLQQQDSRKEVLDNTWKIWRELYLARQPYQSFPSFKEHCPSALKS